MAQDQHVTLNIDDIRVDADPEKLGQMMNRLMTDPAYRKQFESDPVAGLKSYGINVPASARERITREAIDATLQQMTEGGDATTLNVAVGVRVGTRPGTRPGVSVGVRVATGTSTFGAARPISEDESR